MKILHVVPTYLPATRYGGPIYSVHGLCSALASNDLSVSVYTTSVDGPDNSNVDHGRAYLKDDVEIFYFESKYLRRIYYSAQLSGALQENICNFDLLHLHSIFLYPTNIAARIARRNHVPYVLSPRGMLEKGLIRSKSSIVKKTWLALIEKKTIENASLIHITSDRESRELDKFNYDFPDRVMIPNGVSGVLCENDRKNVASNRFQILFLGRVNWKKQIDKIIQSLKYIDFEIKLVIAGNDEEGYRSILNKLIIDLGLNSEEKIQIDFTGEVNNAQKKHLYLNSDAMLLPSKSENFGNTVIEALAMGCPVIVTPEVGASKIVRQAQAGMITDGSPRSIASCISKIRNNPVLARQMSVNGINEIRQNYLWGKIACRMKTAYQKVISANA